MGAALFFRGAFFLQRGPPTKYTRLHFTHGAEEASLHLNIHTEARLQRYVDLTRLPPVSMFRNVV